MNNLLTLADTKPELLRHIRLLARQGLTRRQIIDQLHREGHQMHLSTLYRISRNFGIPIRPVQPGRRQ